MNNLEMAATRTVLKQKSTEQLSDDMIKDITTTGLWNEEQSWEGNELVEYDPNAQKGPVETCASRLLGSSKAARHIAITTLISEGIPAKEAEYQVEDMIRVEKEVPDSIAKALVAQMPETFGLWPRSEKIQTIGIGLQLIGVAVIAWKLLS